MLVREPPPLRHSIDVETPGGLHYAWSLDDPDPANIPSGLRHSSTIPGGFESSDVSLPRLPCTDYVDLERLSTMQVVAADGEVVSETRLERAPRVSGRQMVVSPSAVGWQAHLEDDKSVCMVYADQDVGARWETSPFARRRAIAAAGFPQGKIPVDIRNGGISWQPPGENAAADERTEVQYDIGVGLKAARLEYRGTRTGAFTNFETPTVFASDDEAFGASTNEALTLDDTINVATTFTDARYLMLRARLAIASSPIANGYEQSYDRLTVYGNHGIPLTAVDDDETSGILARLIVAHAVERWAPLLNFTDDTVFGAEDEFPVPHAVFHDRTTVGEIVRQITRYGLEDWAVWVRRTFYWHPRGARGRKWRARVAPAELEETGAQVDRLWESVIVQYSDVAGTRTVGPPGSGADTETSLLKDSDPDNPANKLGIVRRDLLVMGVGTVRSATEVGRRFLEEQKLLDTSGRAKLVGHVEDDRGVLHPFSHVRGGDSIAFVDAADSSYRRIVRADHLHADRSCGIDLDAPPEGLQALLERLGVVLVPLGLG